MSLRSFLAAATAAALAAACTAAPAKNGIEISGQEDSYIDLPSSTGEGQGPLVPEVTNSPDAATNKAPSRPTKPVEPGGEKVFCEGALRAGDLALVEIMISSRSGSGDTGEWVEIQNTRDCWLSLKGLAVESPRGAAAPDVVTINEDFELAPSGTFVVAGSADPAKNGGLPGKVFAWNATDVLKNDGDSLNLKLGTMLVDTLAYPSLAGATAGSAMAFPNDCGWGDRKAWTKWTPATAEYATGKKGTPNALNVDVTCAP